MGTVKKGSKGIAVHWLQRDLLSLGYELTIDGVCGVDTVQAIKAFQRDHGLTEDGVAGPITWDTLNAAMEQTTPEVTETPAPSDDALAQVLEEAKKVVQMLSELIRKAGG